MLLPLSHFLILRKQQHLNCVFFLPQTPQGSCAGVTLRSEGGLGSTEEIEKDLKAKVKVERVKVKSEGERKQDRAEGIYKEES